MGVEKCVRACTLPRPLIIPAKNICAFVNGFDMSLEFELYLFVDSVANETRASFNSTVTEFGICIVDAKDFFFSSHQWQFLWCCCDTNNNNDDDDNDGSGGHKIKMCIIHTM